MENERRKNRITAFCQAAALLVVTAALIAQVRVLGEMPPPAVGQPQESAEPAQPKLSRAQQREAATSISRRYMMLSEVEGLGEERQSRLDAIAAELGF